MLEALNATGEGRASVQMIDSTIIRAHQHAAGALKAIGSGLGSWPLARWLLDQDPSPLQRSGPPCRGLSERRSDLGCEGLCAGDGPTRSRPLRPARRQGLRRRLHPGRPGSQRRRHRHPRSTIHSGASKSRASSGSARASSEIVCPRTETPAVCTVSGSPETSGCQAASGRPSCSRR